MTDRVVVITGAFGALGRTVAARAAAEGARVVALDFAPTAPEGLTEVLGSGALVRGGVDLAKAEAAEAALAAAVEACGHVDVLINIAGGFAWETVGEGDVATWERLHAMNVMTTLNACRAALPHLTASPSGRIVNIGANGGVKAGMGMGAYAASKAGVHRLTEALAEEYKGRVTVNAVMPSIIDTPTNRADMPDADVSTWVSTDELASVILFLASEQASAVTGALVPVIGRV
jgi:NAD(P)-dependent dehydrogenase (short-subunit alcohol dehydrogenase family)